ncbi:MAG: YihY/virulence factor BrkB family protein [Pseudomonadota bacterium]
MGVFKRTCKTLWWVARAASTGFSRHEGMIMAGYMAFLGLLALFPFLIFLTALAGAIGRSREGVEAISHILEAMPPEVASVLAGPITEVVAGVGGGVLTFGALVAIWTAASGIEAARAAVRRAYSRRSPRPLWSRRLESLALVIVTASLILIGMSIQVLGPAAWGLLSARVDMPAVLDSLWRWLRFALSPLAMYLALYTLYFVLTPRRIRPRYRAPGAFLALILWLATATGLSTYLKYFGQYDITYGSLAGVMVTMIFLFLVAAGFVLGAEVNAAMARRARARRRQGAD